MATYCGSFYSFLPSQDDMLALDIAFTIYMKFEDLASGLRIALFLDNIQVSLGTSYSYLVFSFSSNLLH